MSINKVQDKGGNTLWDFSSGSFVSSMKEFASQNLKLLSTQIASSHSSISFTTGIDSTYDVYIFKFININVSTDQANFSFNLSTDGGSTYAVTKTTSAFRAEHLENDTSDLDYQAGSDLSQSTAYQILGSAWGSDADSCGAGEIHLFNPSSTTYVKHWYSTTSFMRYNSNPGEHNFFSSGYGNTTTAVNSVDFKCSAGEFDGIIKMYGVL